MTRTAHLVTSIAAITAALAMADTAQASPGAAVVKAASKACAGNRSCQSAARRLGTWLRIKGEMAADKASDGIDAVGSTVESVGKALPSAAPDKRPAGQP